mgnify:CR=1 FL=1
MEESVQEDGVAEGEIPMEELEGVLEVEEEEVEKAEVTLRGDGVHVGEDELLEGREEKEVGEVLEVGPSDPLPLELVASGGEAIEEDGAEVIEEEEIEEEEEEEEEEVEEDVDEEGCGGGEEVPSDLFALTV